MNDPTAYVIKNMRALNSKNSDFSPALATLANINIVITNIANPKTL